MKDEIRRKLKIKRRDFRNIRREAADAEIFENFMNAFKKYGSFFIYNSFGSEADTKKIISALLKADKRVYLPRVEGDNIVAVPYGTMRVGAFGIEEPVGQAFAGDIEVTVIPLLAVNGRGYRIGYGGGYYDRYLAGHTEHITVALCYAFQITEENLPWEEHDILPDYIITEKEIF